jgi:hypothetical protein
VAEYTWFFPEDLYKKCIDRKVQRLDALGTKINMANHARYGDMTVNPDHTPRKITKIHMIKRKSIIFK